MTSKPTNKQSTIDSSSFINAKADIAALYDSIVNIVFSLRSDDPLKSGVIPERSDEDLGSVAGESTLNALYRAIGLPAVRNDEALASYTLAQKSQDGSLNYISLTELDFEQEDLTRIESRERILAQKRPLDVPPPATSENILRGTKLMIDRILPNAGVAGFGGKGETSDKSGSRQSLFPMVACGDVTVYPRERATAPLFYDKTSFVADIRQQRPLIEYVILSKLAPIYDEQSAEQLVNAIVEIAAPSAAAQSKGADRVAKVAQLKNDLQRSEGQSLLSLRLIQKLYSFLSECAGKYFDTRETVARALERVSYVPVLNGNTPGKKQGSYDISYDEQVRLLNLAGSDGYKLAEKLKPPTLDKEIAEIETEIARLSIFFTIGTSSSASVSDTVQRVVDLVDAEKAISDTFEDIIVQICTVDRQELRAKLATKQQERDRQRSELENLRQLMDLYTGETLGFSIFDFLAIMIALYISPVDDLIGLLNKDAKTRLRRIPGLSTLVTDAGNPFSDFNTLQFQVDISAPLALERLQGRVTEVLNVATAIFEAKRDKK
jgi:hypothetical protein